MSKVAVFFINIYQFLFSPDAGVLAGQRPVCRFLPSCSEYTKQAIIKYGFFDGMLLGVRRVLKCHPWHAGGHDPLL